MPYIIRAISITKDNFLIGPFKSIDDTFGIKVRIKTTPPIVINTELVERFPSEPV